MLSPLTIIYLSPYGILINGSPRLSRSSSTSRLSIEKARTEGDLESQPTLKLFASPLTHERKTSTTELLPEPVLNISGPVGIVGTRPLDKQNIYDDRKGDVTYHTEEKNHGSDLRETPEFLRYQETTNIELFYDLFFVANLTTFTDVTDINGVAALKSYAGFFCILWFLWVQVSLFDVRFVTDSILERIGKAAQFGIMIGLAVVGPNFNTTAQTQGTFRSLAIILMLSRAILGFQYLLVLYHVWNYKNSKLPLALIASFNC